MRIEEIEKEAEMFDREKEAYIHMEKTTSTNYKVIVSGDYPTIMQGIHGLMSCINEMYGVSEKEQLKQLSRAFRKFGTKEIL